MTVERRRGTVICRRAIPVLGVALALALLAGVARADTVIGGNVTSNTALLASHSPYRIDSDLVVQAGATLSIQPGVTVYLEPGVNIILQTGSIRSDGTASDPVLITSVADDGSGSPAPGDWGVLRFENGTNDAGTRLRHTTIRYGTGVEIQSASPLFDFCTISYMSGTAMAIDLASFPTGVGNSADNCGLNGILVPAGDITQSGSWALRGIPYVVQGRVSIGQSPAVSSIDPDTVQRLDSIDVQIGGQRLAAVSEVIIEGTGVAPTIQSTSDTSVTVHLVVDIDAALGPRSFTLVTPAGLASSTDAGLSLTIAPPVPILSAISPDSVVAGSGDFTLTANGSRFDLGAEVVVDGTAVPTTRVSATQLTGDVPGSLITTAGDLSVLVRNPDPANPGLFLESVPLSLTVEPPQITLSPDPLLVISGETANLVLSVPLVAPSGGLVFDLSTTNAGVADVPAQVSILQGSSSVPILVTGGTTGSATVTASRATFLDGSAQIDVVPPPILVPVQPLLAPEVGVQVGVTEPPGNLFPVDPQVAAGVGLTVGPAILGVSPDHATQGSSGVSVTVQGVQLGGVTSVELYPPDDLTVEGLPVVAGDGTSVTFTLSIASTAAPTSRAVRLLTATDAVPPGYPGADQFLVTLPAPQIISIDPFAALPGTVTTLTLRGQFLEDALLVEASPSADVLLGSEIAVDTSGTVATVDLQIGPAATLGPRLITITTPGGTSSGTATAANTLTIVDDLGSPFTPLIAPVVGVEVTVPPGPGGNDFPVASLLAASAGALVGSGITGITPPQATIDTTALDVTIEGIALGGATAVSFDPPDGITINSGPTPAGDGSSVALNVDIAADAPVAPRRVLVEYPGGIVPAVSPGADVFDVTLPPPVIESLVPNRGLLGSSMTVTIHGHDLTGATAVTFTPPDGIAVNPPSVDAAGESATVNILIDPAAPLGQRLLQITTPGGTSTDVETAANRFEITDQVGDLFTPLIAPVVGVEVVVPPGPGDNDFPVAALQAPAVGVVVTTTPQPEPEFAVEALQAASVGVTVGAATTGVSPKAAPAGTVNLDLTVAGVNLQAVDSVTLEPATDITLNGPPVVAGDGSSVTVNLSIEIGAARGYRKVLVSQPSGAVLPAPLGSDLFFIGDVAEIASISPNVVAIGSAFTLTVNGTNLDRATRVDFLPPEDILVGSPVVNAEGTQLTVEVSLAGAITPGARVVTVTTPAGTSTSSASAANTLTIVSSSATWIELTAPSVESLPDEMEARLAAYGPTILRASIAPGPRLDPVRQRSSSRAVAILGSRFAPAEATSRLPGSETRTLIDPPVRPEPSPTGLLPTARASGALSDVLLPRPPTSRS